MCSRCVVDNCLGTSGFRPGRTDMPICDLRLGGKVSSSLNSGVSSEGSAQCPRMLGRNLLPPPSQLNSPWKRPGTVRCCCLVGLGNLLGDFSLGSGDGLAWRSIDLHEFVSYTIHGSACYLLSLTIMLARISGFDPIFWFSQACLAAFCL
ncbi:hypothetical protein F5Y03DRAFT_100572 [Xylaria venustula]|nr:hypothetical protein F5Y03DRAFT_100572 [Xylaria venustula]